VLPLSRAATMLWMNGNDRQPAEASVPALFAALARSLAVAIAANDVVFES
jgi:hypothetical protein